MLITPKTLIIINLTNIQDNIIKNIIFIQKLIDTI